MDRETHSRFKPATERNSASPTPDVTMRNSALWDTHYVEVTFYREDGTRRSRSHHFPRTEETEGYAPDYVNEDCEFVEGGCVLLMSVMYDEYGEGGILI